MAIFDHVLSIVVPATILLHLWIAPYSKVEESFNLQATHDIIRYGIPKFTSPNVAEILKAEYDHFSFPGAVPRTFVGSLVLAGFSKPFIALLGHRLNEQLIVRGVLGLFNALAILLFRQAAAKGYGRGTANWYLLLQCSQFHVMYYASRTLPNIFAFGLSIIGLKHFLPRPLDRRRQSASYRLGIYILTFTAIVFRSELALYLGIQALYFVTQGRLSLIQDVILAGIAGSIVGLSTTLAIDSLFWQSYSPKFEPPIFSTPFLTAKFGLIWPEFSAFHYNALLNKAAEWGTSPWHSYFTSSLPKLLMNPLAIIVLLPMTVTVPGLKKGAADILIPIFGFVAGYSALAHKEWRFIIYVVPGMTLVAGMGANWIWTRRNKSTIYSLLSVVIGASVLCSFILSTGMLLISSLNYPGGTALNKLHDIIPSSNQMLTFSDSTPSSISKTMIHLDVPICMTGATRFLQEKPLFPKADTKPSNWVFDKTEDSDSLLDPWFWNKMDYILSSRGAEHVIGRWETLDVIMGYKSVKIYRPNEKTDGGFHRQFELGGLQVGRWWGELEKKLRYQYMEGWWVDVEMQPMVWILKRVKDVGNEREMGWE